MRASDLRGAAPAALAILLAASFTLAPASVHAEDLLVPVRAKMDAAQARLDRAPDPLEAAPLLLQTGHQDAAAEQVPKLLALGPEGKAAAAEALFAVFDFEALRPVIADLQAEAPDDPHARRLVYRWWEVTADLGKVDSTLSVREKAGDMTEADRLMKAELRAQLMDYDAARSGFEAALAAAGTAADSARALAGLGTTVYRQRDFDASLDYLTRALALSDPDPDLLDDLAQTLIRLGRTDEAIDADELAVRVDVYHERAHYMLGNGYARKNYTQLFAAYPQSFADARGREALARADSLLARGDLSGARRHYQALHLSYPAWADVLTRLGSLEWELGRYDRARDDFMQSLAACPEYGRAHNGLAKALEAKRLAVEAHLPEYERRFAATPMPDVPGIETFVVNWNSLSPRHQKRVALSIEPWKRYVPVLIESGATYYIKPLYELLSETPGQETLRDLRINYDSRLWDDVRGCGGYHTVTGVEDVERTIHDRYNTVLHELTHQVHGVLPAAGKREIQELYRQTKEREEGGADAFLSRYAGGSVWEYFAEGANALESPRFDRYDTREIVLERLDAKDPALKALVQRFMTGADVESCYAVGYANRGDDALERGRPGEAIESYRKALARTPGEESATGSLVFALEVADSASAALDLAQRASAADPASASLLLRKAAALRMAGRGLDSAIDALREGRDAVREEERWQVDQGLGGYLWSAGKAEEAREAYARVLDYQKDNPEGIWGMASAAALAGNAAEAWKRYEDVVRLRTGVVDLRNDYARDLLLAGETDRAEEQVKAALLLDPGDPNTLALSGWVALARGDASAALAEAEKALASGPWCDLAVIVKAKAQAAAGDAAGAAATLAPLRERIASGAPPSYVYREKWGRYEQVHTLPAVERRLVEEIG